MICKLTIVFLLVASPALGSAVKGYREEPSQAVKGAPLAAAPVKGGLHHREDTSIKGGQRSEEPIKGREPLRQEPLPALAREEPATKGGRLSLGAPVEQQRLVEQHQATKTSQVRVEESLATKRGPIEHQRHEEKSAPIAEPRVEQREDWQQQKVELVQQKEESIQVQQQREELPLAQQKLEEPAVSALKSIPVRYEARPQVPVDREELVKGQTKAIEQPAIQQQQQHQREQKPWDEKLDNWQQQVEIKQEEHREQQHQEELQQHHLEASQQQITSEQEQQQQQQYATKGGPLVAPAGMAEPYAFDYSIEGSSRRESGDVNGVVRGQYTLQGADGSSRIVDYVADANGFRASVNTNEAGTESRGPAGVEIRSSQPAAEDISLRLEGKTRAFLSPPEVAKPPAVPAKPDNWQVKGPPAKGASEPLPLTQQIELAQQVELLSANPRAPTKSVIREEQPIVQQQELAQAPTPAKTIDTIQRSIEALPIEQAAAAAVDQRLPLAPAPAPIKQQTPEAELDKPRSAELRAPKSLVRSGVQFESATAHRPVLGGPTVLTPLPVAARQHHQQVVLTRTSPARQQAHQRLPARQPLVLEQPRPYQHLPVEVPVASGRRPALQQHQPRLYSGPIGTYSIGSDEDSISNFERSS